MNVIKQISPEQFRDCLRSGEHCVIDVRNRDEFASGSEATYCLPVGEINEASLDAFVREGNLAPAQTVVLLCAFGKRAQLAAEKLRPLLPNPVAVVQGGRAGLLNSAPGSSPKS
jgi:rhodanese-related sulfurtransferase